MRFPRLVRDLARVAPLVAALLGASTAEARPRRRDALPLAPCLIGAEHAAQRSDARCGTLEVPEDWSNPGGRKLRLRVAVVDAEAATAAPDAVFVLAGGPGQVATDLFPALEAGFARIARQRDVVLVDQRGTGGSGRLSCPDVPEPSRGRELPDAEIRRRVRACADALSKDADLTRYGTDAFVRDLDAVRAALGYERIDLVGFSYGTRAALVYLRTFPDRVRALVLDAVAPMQMIVAGSFERDAQAALEALFARCEGDAACRKAHPTFRADFDALLARLAKGPVKTPVRDPWSGAREELAFGLDHLRHVVLAFSYASESAALLAPLVRAAAQGDLEPLAGTHRLAAGDVDAQIDRPLQFSVLCSEDIPFVKDEPAEVDRARYLGRSTRDAFRTVCEGWPKRPVPATWHEPVRSDVPALLLSGEADPVTPPSWARLVEQDFPNARHLVLGGEGHGAFLRGCVPNLAAAFLEAGTAAGLDTSCVGAIRPAPMFLDGNGGAP
jgi:pimeloyl-ACP methyl ester carboxylesterase